MTAACRHRTTMQLLLVCIAVAVTFSNELPQHRVKKASRKVLYSHVLNKTPKRRQAKFWIPSFPEKRQHGKFLRRLRVERTISSLRAGSRESTSFRNGNFPTLQHEPALSLWFLHADASQHASPEQVHQERTRQRLEQENQSRSWFHRLKRRLQEAAQDEVYQEEDTSYAVGDKDSGYTAGDTDLIYNESLSLNETQTWNVSTEVEFGSPNEEGDETNSTDGQNNTSSVVYTTTTEDSNETTFSFNPIRIRAILSEQGNGGEFLTEKERFVLFQDILSPAIVAWSAALRVDPVVGNLTVDPLQLYDGETCGPGRDSGYPSVPVPLSHLTEGIPDTDIVVYLSLGFVTEPNTLNPFSEDLTGGSTSTNTTTTNASLNDNVTGETGEWSTYDQLQDPESNASTSSVDWPSCTGEYLAASSYCSTDQYDRPTAALLHLCIDDDFFLPRSLERDITTVMHELGHSLGFNTQSMAHFRRPDGTPITPRDSHGNVVDTEVECTGPEAHRSEVLPLPSPNILQFRTVRGVRVAEVVTPSVRQVVRNHFDCQDLIGAELESGNVLLPNETEPQQVSDEEAVASCIGDHWEKRLFRIDLMNPIVDEVPFSLRFSPVTLALFADSGWYQVDLSRTTFSASWGRAAGCSFVNDTCVSEYGEIAEANKQFFCNEVASSRAIELMDEIHGCSPDMTRKAACSMSQYDWELPQEYQYFNATLGSNVGGSEPLLDYCPVYNGFENGLCKEEGNQRILQVNRIEKFGAKNSRCVGGVIGKQSTALCLSIACVIEDRTLRVKVNNVWHLCRYGGQVISFGGDLQSSVICPDPVRTCPTFYCHRDCLGTGGICDYDTGICSCTAQTENGNITGKCGELDTVRPDYDVVFYDDDESVKPVEDSSLSDYYVPTEKALRDGDKELEPWAIALIAVGCCVVVVFGAIAVRVKVRSKRRLENDVDSFWLWRSPPRDDQDENEDPSDPNKEKFVASMLVNMRVNEGNVRIREDSQAESIPETENSITETEGSETCTKESLDQSMEQSLEHFEELMNDDKLDPSFDGPEDEFPTEREPPSSVMRKRTIIH